MIGYQKSELGILHNTPRLSLPTLASAVNFIQIKDASLAWH
jgi:hypothetical protein